MSWQCTEGPYGRYPGEDGYEEDLTRHTVERVERNSKSSGYVEHRVVEHVKKAAKNNKLAWIVGVSSYGVGMYLTKRVFKNALVIEIDENAELVKQHGDNEVYLFENSNAILEISKKGNGFHVPILNVTMDTKKAETLIDKIQNVCGYLVVFAMDGPTKAQEPHYSILKL